LKLEEAIENLKFLTHFKHAYLTQRNLYALQLAIEALKTIALWCKELVLGQPTHLRGETEE
jgi:hypothetical protein